MFFSDTWLTVVGEIFHGEKKSSRCLSARLIKQVRRERAQKLKKMAERAWGNPSTSGFSELVSWWPMMANDGQWPKEKCSWNGKKLLDWNCREVDRRWCEVLPVTYIQSDLLHWTMIRIERIPEYNGTTVSTVVSGRFGHPAKNSENPLWTVVEHAQFRRSFMLNRRGDIILFDLQPGA